MKSLAIAVVLFFSFAASAHAEDWCADQGPLSEKECAELGCYYDYDSGECSDYAPEEEEEEGPQCIDAWGPNECDAMDGCMWLDGICFEE